MTGPFDDESAERGPAWWEAEHWSGYRTMPDDARPVDVDDAEERGRDA